MSEQIRVNIKHRVNNASIKREQRNGREVIVVPSAVAKFDTVLNGILYTRGELEASYQQLEGLPAPLGHPVVANQFVSARTPEAINGFWAGAWNTNPRIEGDRVFADKVIDVEFAKNSENGRKLLAAIDAGEPISTSTGLLMERDPAPEGADYQWVGRNYAYDHDAILLNETPAIGTADGVGMMVNAKGEQVEVINSELDVDDDFLTMMAWEMVEQDERNKERNRNAGMVERVKNLFKAAFAQAQTEQGADGLTANQSNGEPEMTVTKEAFDALNAKVDALVANAEKQPSVAEQITEALKPVTEQLQANAEAEKAKAAAEKATAVEAVVNAKLATQEEAEALDLPALQILARNAKQPKGVAGIGTGFTATNADNVEFEAPEAI